MFSEADEQGLEGSTCPGGIYYPKLTLTARHMQGKMDEPLPQLQELTAFPLTSALSVMQPQALLEQLGSHWGMGLVVRNNISLMCCSKAGQSPSVSTSRAGRKCSCSLLVIRKRQLTDIWSLTPSCNPTAHPSVCSWKYFLSGCPSSFLLWPQNG